MSVWKKLFLSISNIIYIIYRKQKNIAKINKCIKKLNINFASKYLFYLACLFS